VANNACIKELRAVTVSSCRKQAVTLRIPVSGILCAMGTFNNTA